MLIRRMEKTVVARMALSGMSRPGWTWGMAVNCDATWKGVGLTFSKNPWKGTPWSRAKENSWREAVAMFVTAQNCERITRMDAMVVAPWGVAL